MKFNYKLSEICSNFAIIFNGKKEWANSDCACVVFLNAYILHSDFALKFLPKGNTIRTGIISSNSTPEKSVQCHHFMLPRKHLPQINDPLLQMKCLPQPVADKLLSIWYIHV